MSEHLKQHLKNIKQKFRSKPIKLNDHRVLDRQELSDIF